MQTPYSSGALLSAPWCTVHPFTERDQAAMTQMRAMVAPNKGKLRGVGARPVFDDIIRRSAAPVGISYREDRVGGISGWWCEPEGARTDQAILHLHGGWFNWGSAEAFRHLVGQIARGASVKAFIPDYRLAPEHPFPSATADAGACLEGLLESGLRAIAVTGDSAGGNLALSVLASASKRADVFGERIVGAVVMSPVTDLTLCGSSWESRAEADPFFVKEQARGLVEAYLAGHDPADPAASPLFDEPISLPPVRIHVGDAEMLRDDSLNYAAKAIAAGIDAKVDVWEGMTHGFLGNVGKLQAADTALDLISSFLMERLDTRTPQAFLPSPFPLGADEQFS
jgi:monoterpene epsilon-lactone hydrolase